MFLHYTVMDVQIRRDAHFLFCHQTTPKYVFDLIPQNFDSLHEITNTLIATILCEKSLALSDGRRRNKNLLWLKLGNTMNIFENYWHIGSTFIVSLKRIDTNYFTSLNFLFCNEKFRKDFVDASLLSVPDACIAIIRSWK